MRVRAFIGATTAALVAVLALAAAPVEARTAPFCGIRWGSLPKDDPTFNIGSVTNLRAGRHACFDRVVVDVSGPATGYSATYVDQVTRDGSGDAVPLRGGAFIRFVVHAPDFDINTGASTYDPSNQSELVNVSGFRTLRQVAHAGSFEGQTTFGIGVRARLPFRVFILDGPGSGSRVVVDVAHRWS